MSSINFICSKRVLCPATNGSFIYPAPRWIKDLDGEIQSLGMFEGIFMVAMTVKVSHGLVLPFQDTARGLLASKPFTTSPPSTHLLIQMYKQSLRLSPTLFRWLWSITGVHQSSTRILPESWVSPHPVPFCQDDPTYWNRKSRIKL